MTGFYHAPVLGPETVDLLEPNGEGLYLDGTVGGGGHALLLLERCPHCRLLAVDRDPEALEACLLYTSDAADDLYTV